MKVSLVVIALLFISPAYAFENLIIDSTFQYPVGLTGKATSWSDTNAPVQNPNFSAAPNLLTVPHLPTVPNLPAMPYFLAQPNLIPVPNLFPVPNLAGVPNLPVPNPLASASPVSSGAQNKPPGNLSDAQLATTSSNAP